MTHTSCTIYFFGMCLLLLSFFFFFFNDTATTEIYTLSLHDALPISCRRVVQVVDLRRWMGVRVWQDRKSTRLNSSHLGISYAVFCLKKKKKQKSLNELKTKKKINTINLTTLLL